MHVQCVKENKKHLQSATHCKKATRIRNSNFKFFEEEFENVNDICQGIKQWSVDHDKLRLDSLTMT